VVWILRPLISWCFGVLRYYVCSLFVSRVAILVRLWFFLVGLVRVFGYVRFFVLCTVLPFDFVPFTVVIVVGSPSRLDSFRFDSPGYVGSTLLVCYVWLRAVRSAVWVYVAVCRSAVGWLVLRTVVDSFLDTHVRLAAAVSADLCPTLHCCCVPVCWLLPVLPTHALRLLRFRFAFGS